MIYLKNLTILQRIFIPKNKYDGFVPTDCSELQRKLDSITSKTITENGTYEAEVGYNPVTVNVEADVVDFEVTVPADTTNTFTPQPPHQGFKKVKVIAAPDGRVDELQQRINELESDVEDKQRKLDSIAQIEIKANGTYTAEVGYNPIIVDVGEEPQLQEKDVSLETIYQTIYPDSDYVGMRVVYVNCQDIVEGVKEEYQAKIDKSEMDYTKVGNVYVTPPLADQYGFMAVIKCTRQGRLLLNMNNDMSLYFSNYKIGVDGDVSVHSEMSQVYFDGNFEKDKNYVLWFNTPNGNAHVGTTDFEEGDIKSIVIPSTVTSVGEKAFNSSDLSLITCYATTAPTLEDKAFTECMETGILRVPQGATGYNNWLTQLGSGWTIEYMS